MDCDFQLTLTDEYIFKIIKVEYYLSIYQTETEKLFSGSDIVFAKTPSKNNLTFFKIKTAKI
jgi:hypothetical protein